MSTVAAAAATFVVSPRWRISPVMLASATPSPNVSYGHPCTRMSALASERDTLLGHLRLEIVDAEHAELVVRHGRLEVFRDAIERFA